MSLTQSLLSPSMIKRLKNGKTVALLQANSISVLMMKAIPEEAYIIQLNNQIFAKRALTTHSSGALQVTSRAGTAAMSSKIVQELIYVLMSLSIRRFSTCCAQTS